MPIEFETDPEWVCSIVRMKMSPISPLNHQIHTLARNSNALDGNGMHHGHDRCHLHLPPLISHAINTALHIPLPRRHMLIQCILQHHQICNLEAEPMKMNELFDGREDHPLIPSIP